MINSKLLVFLILGLNGCSTPFVREPSSLEPNSCESRENFLKDRIQNRLTPQELVEATLRPGHRLVVLAEFHQDENRYQTYEHFISAVIDKNPRINCLFAEADYRFQPALIQSQKQIGAWDSQNLAKALNNIGDMHPDFSDFQEIQKQRREDRLLRKMISGEEDLEPRPEEIYADTINTARLAHTLGLSLYAIDKTEGLGSSSIDDISVRNQFMAKKLENLLSGPNAHCTGGVLIVGKSHIIQKTSEYKSLRDFEIFQNAAFYNVEIESFDSHSENALKPPSCSFKLSQPKQPYAFITNGPTPTMATFEVKLKSKKIHAINPPWHDFLGTLVQVKL